MKSVLTIAGSDSSGGAGIQADLKTITACGMYGQSAITAITAQNTLGVTAVHNVPAAHVAAQIDAVFDDITPDAVKIGMVPTPEVARAIASALMEHGARNIVLDPVMVATSGASLSTAPALEALVEHLMPLATIITPNLPEAQVLANVRHFPETVFAAKDAAKLIACLAPGAYVLIKGGHGLVAAAAPDAADAPDAPDAAAPAPANAAALSPVPDVAATAPSPAPAANAAGGEVSASIHAMSSAPASGSAAESVFATTASPADALDIMRAPNGMFTFFSSPFVNTKNTHGTGCTLSSAIACGLAAGLTPHDAVARAKAYIHAAISANPNLGHGHGPLGVPVDLPNLV